ncbi:hypothetical protein DFH11DRAFT_1703970 [Phellopilus nigrolimitatus]|nr:hypothetical protein DFH11DRAFT_1703970 [Phellopilus nigrolimitatus]
MTRPMSFAFSFVCILIFALASLIAVDSACAIVIPFTAVSKQVVKTNAKRDVWAPPVTNPAEGTVWRVGDTVQVTWSTVDPPKHVTNSNGMIVLRNKNGFLKGQGGLGEPLASNFSIYDGHVEVQVPKVPARDDYQVVLFGDSGNESPRFTISNPILAALGPF